MELRQLKTFLKITEAGSFLQAARELGYAQSTVTTQIQLLEREIGVRLFEKIGRRMALTEKGTVFLDYVKRITALADESREVVSNKAVPAGKLIVGAVESLCTEFLPALLKKYHEKYPQVEVAIKVDTSSALHDLLKANSADCIFTVGKPIEDGDLISYMSHEVAMGIFASPSNRLAADGGSTGLADISAESLILTEKGCSYRELFEDVLKNEKIIYHLSFAIGSIEAIKTFVRNNLGITFLPVMCVKKELLQKELVRLKTDTHMFHVVSQVLYHKNKCINQAMQALLWELDDFAFSFR